MTASEWDFYVYGMLCAFAGYDAQRVHSILTTIMIETLEQPLVDAFEAGLRGEE